MNEMEKICRQRTIKQADSSNTEATLILCGYSRELANIAILVATVDEEWRQLLDKFDP